VVNLSDIVRFEKLEDRITAQLIATLEHSQRDRVLSKFFELFHFEYDGEEADFQLQVQEYESRPDAMIQSESFLICIEVKLGDAIDSAQIENHFEGGKGKKPRFVVLCITAGLDQPKGIKEATTRLQAKGESPDIRWISWKRIYGIIKDMANIRNDDKTSFLLNSLIETLRRENLSGFTNFKKEDFPKVKETIPAFTKTIEKCNMLMAEVASILEKESIEQVVFYRDGKATGKIDLVTEAKYVFSKKDWEPKDKDSLNGSEVIVQFFFGDAVLILGFQINKDVIYKQNAEWNALIQLIKEKPEYNFGIGLIIQGRSTDVEPEDFLRRLEETREDKAIDSVFCWRYFDLSDTKTVALIDPDTIATLIEGYLDLLQRHNLFTPIKPE
jgi:hypothetical protein